MISLGASSDPTGKLGPEPWLTDPATLRVINALRADGDDVRFVGGCVRDAIAKRPVKDIDIGTPSKPDRIIELLAKAGIKSVPTGLKHGTVTAVTDGRTFEVTTLRRDIETDGRRAVVAFTDDWIVDSSRRDFTINALSATVDGDVYDYHDGIPDLAHGRIRFIGRAEDRVTEDYLRIMRYFRFYAALGRPPYDEAAFHACRKHADGLESIAAERIREELLKLLRAHDPSDALIMMRDAHVLEVVLPEATEIGTLRTAAWLAERGVVIDGLKPDPLRRLGALLKPGTDAAAIGTRLKLSNVEQVRLIKMLELVPALAEPASDAATRRLMHARGAEAVADAGIIAWAKRLADVGKLSSTESAARRSQLEIAFAWQPPALPVTGKDAEAMGLGRGPQIGETLRAIEDWWAEGDFKADRDACLAAMEKIIKRLRDKT